jgi:hypothetical protein
MKEQLTKIADSMFRTLLPLSAEEHGNFRLLMSVNVDGAPKPLLIVGAAHPRIEDGDCIAVLNPDPELMDELAGGVAYGGRLNEIVQGKCDAMVHLWIEAYGRKPTDVLYSYTCIAPSSAKFKVN